MWKILLFYFVLFNVLIVCYGERIVHDMGPIPDPVYEPKVKPWAERNFPLFEDFNVLPPKYKAIFAEQKERITKMFKHAFDGYRDNALYFDELKSNSCTGSNELGGFSISLIEGISTLLLLDPAVGTVEKDLNSSLKQLLTLIDSPNKLLERNVDISVFETTIRLLGPLLSIYQIADGQIKTYHTDKILCEEDLTKLLRVCEMLGDKLLLAYVHDIPFPYINLIKGVTSDDKEVDTLVSAAGTALLEFGLLSELTKNGRYRGAAETAAITLYHKRNQDTGLLGTRLSVRTGEWLDPRSSVGGNADSYLEYMAKYPKWEQHIHSRSAKRWDSRCKRLLTGLKTYSNFDRYWIDVHMATGKVIYPYFYSLGAFWPSVLVIQDRIEEAEQNFAAIMSLWQTYGGIPEVQNVMHAGSNPLIGHQQYFLRPEVAESAFYLYQATKDVRYQYAGYLMLEAIENTMKTRCGYTILESVVTKEQGDKMPSYFLGETLKYLYLLFDDAHPVFAGNFFENIVLSTEGQLFAIPQAKQFSFVSHEEL